MGRVQCSQDACASWAFPHLFHARATPWGRHRQPRLQRRPRQAAAAETRLKAAKVQAQTLPRMPHRFLPVPGSQGLALSWGTGASTHSAGAPRPPQQVACGTHPACPLSSAAAGHPPGLPALRSCRGLPEAGLALCPVIANPSFCAREGTEAGTESGWAQHPRDTKGTGTAGAPGLAP